jgi:hypothetical protein
MKPITKEWLVKHDACKDGVEWFVKNCEGLTFDEQIKRIRDHSFNYINWYLTEKLESKNLILYATNAAELSLPIYEKEYPDDKRPRLAIKAARDVAKNPSDENREVALYAAWEASAASVTAWEASAASVAAWATWKAASAAWATASATSAAWATAHAASAAREAAMAASEIKDKIIDYGLELLKEKE